MSVKLSVCIPAYNRGDHIGETLEGVIRQATDEVEIVVSDNASTDDTRAVVERYASRFPRLHYHRAEANAGADRNYLKVIELANAPHCWLLGSDDLVAKGGVAAVLGNLTSDVDVLLFDRMNMTFDMGATFGHERLLAAPGGRVFDCADERQLVSYLDSVRSLAGLFSFISSIVVRKEAWDREPVLEEFVGSAWIHVTKIFSMLKHGAKLRYLDQPLVLSRGDNDSFAKTVGYTGRQLIDLDYVRIAREVFADMPEAREAVLRFVESYCFNLKRIIWQKRMALRSDGPAGVERLRTAYGDAFAGRPGFRAKMLAWELAGERILPLADPLYLLFYKPRAKGDKR